LKVVACVFSMKSARERRVYFYGGVVFDPS